MSNKTKMGASSFWVIVMTLGILGCLAGVFYTFYMIQEEAELGIEKETMPQKGEELGMPGRMERRGWGGRTPRVEDVEAGEEVTIRLADDHEA